MKITINTEHLSSQSESGIKERYNIVKKQWEDTKSKLDTFLVSTHLLSVDELRNLCLQLNDSKSRFEFISQHWGRIYADKSQPILLQLELLERELASLEKV